MLDTMFSKIGKKIQTLAKIFFGIGIGISILVWLVLLATGIANEELGLVAYGILALIVGILSSWMGNVLFYGFGRLIENSEILANRTGESSTESTSDATYYTPYQ